MTTITRADIYDLRFDLPAGAGSDAVHTNPQYGYAVVVLGTDTPLCGTGLTYTLGGGTNVVCEAIPLLVSAVLGQDVEELMADFGRVQREMAEHPQLRWLGPHKGVIHGALAAITNGCFDLWARHRQVPLWKLLLDLSPDEVVRLVDWSYLEDVLTVEEATRIVAAQLADRGKREEVLEKGYPGYDTSVGWFGYSDEKIRANAIRAVEEGFTAVKLKVGARDSSADIRRTRLVREAVGSEVKIMLDANQAWSLPKALRVGRELAAIDPYWIEEPTQPDDVRAHRILAEALAPIPIAVGEAVANRVLWKNFLESGGVQIVQADCTRLAGISEFLAVATLATKYPVQLVPHVGDMGQIHQHLVLFCHIGLGHERLFLEAINHLQQYFVEPAIVADGVYQTPQSPGASTELKLAGHSPVHCVTL